MKEKEIREILDEIEKMIFSEKKGIFKNKEDKIKFEKAYSEREKEDKKIAEICFREYIIEDDIDRLIKSCEETTIRTIKEGKKNKETATECMIEILNGTLGIMYQVTSFNKFKKDKVGQKKVIKHLKEIIEAYELALKKDKKN